MNEAGEITSHLNGLFYGIRTVEWAQWPPANFESIPAQAVMCARFIKWGDFNMLFIILYYT